MARKHSVRRAKRRLTKKTKPQNKTGGDVMQNSFMYPGFDSVNKERVNKFRDIVRTSRKNHIEALEKFDKMLKNVFIDFMENRIPENERAIRKSNFKVKFWGLVRRCKTAKMNERGEIEKRFLENWNYMTRPLHGD